MIIPSISEARELDRRTIELEPIASIDLMERASMAFSSAFLEQSTRFESILVFCGPGNNGGDGLAIARILTERGLNVDISTVNAEKGSDDFRVNHGRLPSEVKEHRIRTEEDLHTLPDYDCVIDALFGSGLNRAAEGLFQAAIDWINGSSGFVVAVDIPSGMFGDEPNSPTDTIVRADRTYSFQFPKLALLLPQQGSYAGEVQILEIGILRSEIGKISPRYQSFEISDAKKIYKRREVFSHKGSYGHGLLISGSIGKMGAAALSGKAALRSGIGLLSIHSPKVGVPILQESLNEAMVSEDIGEHFLHGVPDLSPYKAIAIGPGIGTSEETTEMFGLFLKKATVPLVIDADALNILAANPEFLDNIPKDSILTPHPGEFRRLVGNWKDDYERLEFQHGLARDLECSILVKGANSTVCTSEGLFYFNSSGNPGMATAGSGDVLTGIILGLLGQGYSPSQSLLLGVFVHGHSGDIAAKDRGYEGLIASDIVENLGLAFKELY